MNALPERQRLNKYPDEHLNPRLMEGDWCSVGECESYRVEGDDQGGRIETFVP